MKLDHAEMSIAIAASDWEAVKRLMLKYSGMKHLSLAKTFPDIMWDDNDNRAIVCASDRQRVVRWSSDHGFISTGYAWTYTAFQIRIGKKWWDTNA